MINVTISPRITNSTQYQYSDRIARPEKFT